MMDPDRPQKITFAEMRDSGVRGLLTYARTCQPVRSLRPLWPVPMADRSRAAIMHRRSTDNRKRIRIDG
jgi:hypothetical protein